MKKKIMVFFFMPVVLIFTYGLAIGGATECCGYKDSGNTYPCNGGNCTWWAAYKRPETNFPGSGRDAKYWLDLAEKNGLPTGSKPKEGSIAVFENFYPPYGHVAYVESVSDDTFQVTEMSWEGYFGWCAVRTHTYNISEATGFIFPDDGSGSDLPDLVVREIYLTDHRTTFSVNESFRVYTRIKNTGDGDTNHDIRVGYYLSKGNNVDDDPLKTEYDNIDKGKLEDGEDEWADKGFTAPSTPGTYNITVCADTDNDVDEEDESNNCYDSPIVFEVIDNPAPQIPVEAIIAIISNILLSDDPVQILAGDLDGDNLITIADAILALKIMSNYSDQIVSIESDVNNDKKIGLADAIYILQTVSKIR